jgi:hypothetical protein
VKTSNLSHHTVILKLVYWLAHRYNGLWRFTELTKSHVEAELCQYACSSCYKYSNKFILFQESNLALQPADIKQVNYSMIINHMQIITDFQYTTVKKMKYSTWSHMQNFNNRKKHCIQNDIGEVKTRSLSQHENNDTFTHLKIERTWIQQQSKRVFQWKSFSHF